eukprot:182872_1
MACCFGNKGDLENEEVFQDLEGAVDVTEYDGNEKCVEKSFQLSTLFGYRTNYVAIGVVGLLVVTAVLIVLYLSGNIFTAKSEWEKKVDTLVLQMDEAVNEEEFKEKWNDSEKFAKELIMNVYLDKNSKLSLVAKLLQKFVKARYRAMEKGLIKNDEEVKEMNNKTLTDFKKWIQKNTSGKPG